MKPRRKSMTIAFLLWFFLGFLAAHKIYLGRVREALRLILIYFFVPLVSVVAAILILQYFGGLEFLSNMRPEDLPALLKDPAFIALASTAFIVLGGVWLWDLAVLIRQVREHNARVEAEIPAPAVVQESTP